MTSTDAQDLNRNQRWRTPMPDTTCHMSISLDGFVCGMARGRYRARALRKRDAGRIGLLRFLRRGTVRARAAFTRKQ